MISRVMPHNTLKIITIIILIIISSNVSMASAQKYSINITILDSSLNPVKNSWVQINNGLSGSTDYLGNVTFVDIPDGTYLINITALYFFDYTKLVKINSNMSINIILNNTMDRYDDFTQGWGMFETHTAASGDEGYVSSSWDNLGSGNYGLNISWNDSVYLKRSFRLQTKTNNSFINTISMRFKVPGINRSIIFDLQNSAGGPEHVYFRFAPYGNDEVHFVYGGLHYAGYRIPRIPRDTFVTANVTVTRNESKYIQYKFDIDGYGYVTPAQLAHSNTTSWTRMDIYAVWNNTYIVFDYIRGSNKLLNVSLPEPTWYNTTTYKLSSPIGYTLATSRPPWSSVTELSWEGTYAGANWTDAQNISKKGLSTGYSTETDQGINNIYTQLYNTSINYDMYFIVGWRTGMNHTTNSSRSYNNGVKYPSVPYMSQDDRLRLVKDMSNISRANPKFKGIVWDEAFVDASEANVTELWDSRTNPDFELIYLVSYLDRELSTDYATSSTGWLSKMPKYPRKWTNIGYYPRSTANLSYVYDNIVDLYYDCGCKPIMGDYVGTNLPGGINTNIAQTEFLNQTMTAESDGYGGGVFLYGYYGQANTLSGKAVTESINWYKSLPKKSNLTTESNILSITSFSPSNRTMRVAQNTTTAFSVITGQQVMSVWYLNGINQNDKVPAWSNTWNIVGQQNVTYMGSNGNGTISIKWNISVVPESPYDVNQDTYVNESDLGIIKAHFREVTLTYPRANVNGIGPIDILDLTLVSTNIN